ncbi:DHA2 family efflux MFS transporter permease subunit [Solicola gregarius]|uniref:DHA2 family efflux MFS transporter permease subunit n=1 Tax=Solicola gregarius TaxID=2908642 RepID=A0AA46YM53_9ACTN|nr:DHA2 family efflux MFS transporter permease subunit [Solicola gregarius]UYM07347.1 DHA2 family efflux MFS transporter permease subunit [Solicola gregarius]
MSTSPDRADRSFAVLVTVLVLGAVLALVNTTIVGVALPQIGTEFDVGIDALSWVGTAYVLAIAFAIPLSGWASVRFGLRRTWLIALTVFVIGSALSAMAPGLDLLVAARVVQGVGGGMLEPVMLTAIAQAAGPARMGRAMGIVAGAIGLGPLVGPVLGGATVDILDWRWMFGAFVPLGLLAIALSARVLPASAPTPKRLDLAGLLLIGTGSVGVLYGLSQASRPDGIAASGWLTGILGVVVLLAYVRWAALRHDDAIVSLAPFRVPGFVPAATVMLMLGVTIYPLFYGLPQFFQGVLGYGPLGSGVLLVPHGAGALVGMTLGGRLSDRHSTRLLVIAGGLAATTGSVAYVAAGSDAPVWVYAASSVITGVGVGFVGGPTVSSLYRVLEPALVPTGSTVLFILNQLGGALGIAVITILIGVAGDGATAWGPSAGTLPMLLPALGSAVVVLIAARLPGAPSATPLPESQVRSTA